MKIWDSQILERKSKWICETKMGIMIYTCSSILHLHHNVLIFFIRYIPNSKGIVNVAAWQTESSRLHR